MTKNHCLAQSLHDAALGELRRQIEYQCRWNRRHVVTVSRWFPSRKMCGQCGTLHDARTLSDRPWQCDCGAHHHRDVHAARTILRESLKLVAGHANNPNAHGERVSLATASNAR